jgi:hypothetical protein
MPQTTRQTAEAAVSKTVDHLFALGQINLTELTVAQRADYVKHVAGLAALSIATLPCVQEALAITRPFMTSAERYTALVQAVARVFDVPVAESVEPAEDGGAPVN